MGQSWGEKNDESAFSEAVATLYASRVFDVDSLSVVGRGQWRVHQWL